MLRETSISTRPMTGPHRTALARAFVLAVAVAALGGCASTESGGVDAPELTPEQQAAFAAAYGTKGVHHEHLMSKVGSWNTTIKYWMAPDTEPAITEGTAVIESAMGGMFIRERADSEIMDQPFHGEGFLGYDTVADKVVSIWLDSMGSGMYYAEGHCEQDGRRVEFFGSATDTMTGGRQDVRYLQTELDPDRFRFEIFMRPGGGATEWRSMEAIYERA